MKLDIENAQIKKDNNMNCQELYDKTEGIRNHYAPNAPIDLGPIRHKEPYYEALICATRILQPQRTCELGHSYGESAWALAQNSIEVDSYDVSDIGRQKNIVELPTNVNFILLKKGEECLTINFTKYNFIFIDIDHSGFFEMLLHLELKKSKYNGFVFWDDIDINSGMKNFWQILKHDKECETKETNWHFSGFGISKYGEERI